LHRNLQVNQGALPPLLCSKFPDKKVQRSVFESKFTQASFDSQVPKPELEEEINKKENFSSRNHVEIPPAIQLSLPFEQNLMWQREAKNNRSTSQGSSLNADQLSHHELSLR